MRKYSFYTPNRILEKLEKKGCKMSRPTFMRLMVKKELFTMHKNVNGWYVCSPKEVDKIINLILIDRGFAKSN